MGTLFVFGRTLGSHKAPFAIISRDPSSPMSKTIGLVRSLLLTRGRSILSIYLFPTTFKVLFEVFLSHVLLDWRMLSCGLITRVLAPLNLPLCSFTNNNKFPRTNHFGIGFGRYLAPKKFKFSSKKLCVTDYPLSNS